jgi:hypothetical protein
LFARILRMAHPPDRVLDDHYNKWLMECVDNVFKWFLLFVVWQELKWLHLRSHEVSSNKMPYDERYMEYIEKTRLLPFSTVCPVRRHIWILVPSRHLFISGGRRHIVSTCRVGRWLWHCRMFLWSLHFPSEGSLCVWAWIPKNGVVGPGNSSGTRRWQTKGDRWCFLRLDLKKIYYVPRGLIRLKRIYNFLCSMLVYTPFAWCSVTLHGVFMHFLELTY